MPFCLQYGKKLDPEAAYCVYCGRLAYTLPDTESNPLEPPKTVATPETLSPKKKTNSQSWIGALIGIAIFI